MKFRSDSQSTGTGFLASYALRKFLFCFVFWLVSSAFGQCDNPSPTTIFLDNFLYGKQMCRSTTFSGWRKILWLAQQVARHFGNFAPPKQTPCATPGQCPESLFILHENSHLGPWEIVPTWYLLLHTIIFIQSHILRLQIRIHYL